MPYRTARELPDNPDVKIFLTGQLILAPDETGSLCDVGINRSAPDHHFSMEVRQKMIDQSIPDLIIWRHVGPLIHGRITINQTSSIEGVRRFVPTSTFQRIDSFSPKDFRWIVDLVNLDEFYKGPIKLHSPTIEPDVRIRDGIFYTASRTDPTKVKVVRKKGGKDDLDLFRIAAVIGVNIYIATGEKLEFTWLVSGGEENTLLLDKPTEASRIKNYEIWINNNPIDLHPDELPPDELQDYYRAVEEVDEGSGLTTDFKRFELVFTKVVSETPEEEEETGPGLGTPSIPCMPMGADKTI